MASPRLETFCCPNRDAATEFVVGFQPVLFGTLTLASAVLSLLFSILQLLPKRKGYRRLGQYPLPRPASSSRILFIISVCDALGCAGKPSICFFLTHGGIPVLAVAPLHFGSCTCFLYRPSLTAFTSLTAQDWCTSISLCCAPFPGRSDSRGRRVRAAWVLNDRHRVDSSQLSHCCCTSDSLRVHGGGGGNWSSKTHVWM